MEPRALLFDTGDTLWRFPAPVSAEALQALATPQVGALLTGWGRSNVDPLALARDILAGARAAEREAASALLSPDYDAVVQSAAIFRGLNLDANDRAALWRAVYVDPLALGREVYPDARTTLVWARENGYRTAIVANSPYGSEIVGQELRAAGLPGLIDVLSLSCEAGWLKPHARIFMDAVRRLGVRPEEAVMVGDSLAQDIKGAFTLGMTTVWKRNDQRPAPSERLAATPDYQIDELWELRTLPPLRRSQTRSTNPSDAQNTARRNASER